MLNIQNYGSSSGSDNENDEKLSEVKKVRETSHLKPIDPKLSIAKTLAVCAAPEVVPIGATAVPFAIDPTVKELDYNPKYEELFAPIQGPIQPNQAMQLSATRNTLAGYVEQAHINAFEFENQRRTFHTYGYAMDPSVDETIDGQSFVGDLQSAYDDNGKTVFESPKSKKKRKQEKNDNPEDIDGFVGPWGKYENEQSIARPNDEEKAELEEILAKRHRRGRIPEDKPLEEKSTLHIKDAYDYQGRSFLHAPHDLDVNLRSHAPPPKCFLPKAHIHTWTGHNKGITSIRWFPQTAHLLLSGSMDSRIKLWEVYGERRCIRTYMGHRQAIKDICFNNKGTKFLSASYDRYIKLWDAETGDIVSRFTARKMPFCVKFHPDNNKQHLFVAGTSDKKIICWDTRSGDIVQEYDRHLGAVNTITFVDENRRFVTTSDDKSMRIWEWDIPVDMKYIADPTMHSMPAVTLAPNEKWLACQSLDNKIVIFSARNRFKMNRKKSFSGHMVSGYACQLDFSPDMSYLVSGDGDGKCYIWDWKTTKMYKKWQAHEGVCITALWHPHEASKVVTAGWDGVIKFWD
ncbi:pre-mRNA-processing factor 17 [Teleopsis dalmanni]|uniref:pre-mRNA-processing factor 17 n=1 Tax=Teleopsis dalmanni TaxID=139649 RepID=UPI0018CD5876|nr:pre-mRNA-processing factor 17 [Teleopsis dalmanni]